jgi:hypothetical protein
MPGKSRHSKGKHPHHLKKIKSRQHQGTTVSPQPAVAGTIQPAMAKGITAPASMPATPAKLRAASYPYITSELRNIGILTVIILVILIVLARVLS